MESRRAGSGKIDSQVMDWPALSDHELDCLLRGGETDRVEFKSDLSGRAKRGIHKAICAFANDLPGHRAPGVIFVGVRDDGSPSDLLIEADLEQSLSAMLRDGSLSPPPMTVVRRCGLGEQQVAVVVVNPSDAPPVRFNKVVYVSVGNTRVPASPDDERTLIDRAWTQHLPPLQRPAPGIALTDLDLERVRREYLPLAVADEVLAENQRPLGLQLAGLRLATAEDDPRPTRLGVLLALDTPTRHLPGACVQYVRYGGPTRADPVLDQKRLDGPLPDLIASCESVLKLAIQVQTDLSADREAQAADYPFVALRELFRNAVLHRDYDLDGPIHVRWHSDHIDILSPGGPVPPLTTETLEPSGLTVYRNPGLADVLRNLGFVQRFGAGFELVRHSLAENNNPKVQLSGDGTHVLAVVRPRE